MQETLTLCDQRLRLSVSLAGVRLVAHKPWSHLATALHEPRAPSEKARFAISLSIDTSVRRVIVFPQQPQAKGLQTCEGSNRKAGIIDGLMPIENLQGRRQRIFVSPTRS